MKSLKRPRYREFGFRILEILATQTDDGSIPRPTLSDMLKISKSSMSDVLKELDTQRFITRIPWFGNQEKIIITDQGRAEYNSSRIQRLQFPIPYQVQRYLNHRTPKISGFFPIQQIFVDRGLLHARSNCCVFGYPSSGKTLIAEMVMASEIESNGKALYCTPYKALDWQKYEDFRESFGKGLKANVVITDGDNPIRKGELEDARLIIATYERVLGAVRAGEPWLSEVSLLCADEITLLDDEGRGGTVDLVLTYFKNSKKHPRIITLSSLIGNPMEISEWIGAETIVENRRPPGLSVEEWLVYKKNDELIFRGRAGQIHREKTEKEIVPFLVERNLAKGETTLIFAGSRLATMAQAASLMHCHSPDIQLTEKASGFYQADIWEKTRKNKTLFDLIGRGLAFHNAGVQRKARRYVESLMKQDLLKTIVATTTLSHGIDYSIDNVIIELEGALDINKLQGYEYINLKGRTGRYGKSRNASVYIITNKKLAEQSFNKYFQGLPEPIAPLSTLTEPVISDFVMAEAGAGTVVLQSIEKLLKTTLCASRKRVSTDSVRNVLSTLVKSGFLEKTKDEYRITELGKTINRVNMSPSDALLALSLKPDASDKELLDAASNMDIAKKARERSRLFIREPDVVGILTDWMNELTLDEIIKKNGSAYDEQDIMDLADYTSTSLSKISGLFTEMKFRKRLENLRLRVKYGIKNDLAKSGLMDVPYFNKDRKRILARSIFESGIHDPSTLAKSKPKELSFKSGVNIEVANEIINSVKARNH